MTHKKLQTLSKLAGSFLMMGALLPAASCSQEESVASPSECRVSLSVSLPDIIDTRSSYDEGLYVNTLHWSVFEVKSTSTGEDGTMTDSYELVTPQEIENFSGSADISIPLVSGKRYQIALCAINSDNKFATYYPETGKLSVDYSKAVCNSFSDDVFTGVSDVIEIPEGGSYTTEITLTRPFAQLNWGTSDLNEPTVTPYCDGTTATVTISQGQLYTGYDLFTGEVAGEVEGPLTFPAVDCGNLPEEDFPMSGVVLPKLIAMNYLLTSPGKSTINAGLSFKGNLNAEIPVNNADVEANYRTNIYGNMLTNSGDITVSLSRAFNSSDKTVQVTVGSSLEMVNALKNKEPNITIPEGTTVDLTDRGSFNLEDGQTITIDGTLMLENPLKVKTVEGTTPQVTITGKGTIYCGTKNPFILQKGTKTIIRGIHIVMLTAKDSGSVLLTQGAELYCYNVKIDTNKYGLTTSAESAGYIYAENCIINHSSTVNNYAVCSSGGGKIELKDCIVSSLQRPCIRINSESECIVKGGRYISEGTYPVFNYNGNLTVVDGEFMSTAIDAFAYSWSNKTSNYFTLKGGKYCGNIYYSSSTRLDLPAADGYHVEEILNDPDFKYQIVPDNN